MTQTRNPANPDPDAIHRNVRERYTRAAESQGCCGGAPAVHIGRAIGYSDRDLVSVPEGANLGLGCGNPTAIDRLAPGQVVLDLGSGAGFDAFLAAAKVGPTGRVIGVDMTEAMIEKARRGARTAGLTNVEFRRGTIEALPVEDASVDVVLSNCVINLSPDKPQVFREAFRVLRPGGRLMISDLVLDRPLPPEVATSVEAWVGCVAGALLRSDYLRLIQAAGFEPVRVERELAYADALLADADADVVAKDLGMSRGQLESAAGSVRSLSVLARKPE